VLLLFVVVSQRLDTQRGKASVRRDLRVATREAARRLLGEVYC
jgi:hypothetical protein